MWLKLFSIASHLRGFMFLSFFWSLDVTVFDLVVMFFPACRETNCGLYIVFVTVSFVNCILFHNEPMRLTIYFLFSFFVFFKHVYCKFLRYIEEIDILQLEGSEVLDRTLGFVFLILRIEVEWFIGSDEPQCRRGRNVTCCFNCCTFFFLVLSNIRAVINAVAVQPNHFVYRTCLRTDMHSNLFFFSTGNTFELDCLPCRVKTSKPIHAIMEN